MRKFTEKELVIATHNPGKAREIAELLRPYVAKFYSAGELGLAEPEETADSFAGNAVLKAKAAALAAGKPALADDSGLAVNALNGAPGIYSARWAPGKDFKIAMERVWNELLMTSPRRKLGSLSNMAQDPGLRRDDEENIDRSAAFICALALAWPDGHVEVFEGRVEGSIVWSPRGAQGFGYDPIFVPEGYDMTFAEMEPAQKHATSHRARAFERLVKTF